jgi:hypothetical protein
LRWIWRSCCGDGGKTFVGKLQGVALGTDCKLHLSARKLKYIKRIRNKYAMAFFLLKEKNYENKRFYFGDGGGSFDSIQCAIRRNQWRRGWQFEQRHFQRNKFFGFGTNCQPKSSGQSKRFGSKPK